MTDDEKLVVQAMQIFGTKPVAQWDSFLMRHPELSPELVQQVVESLKASGHDSLSYEVWEWSHDFAIPI